MMQSNACWKYNGKRWRLCPRRTDPAGTRAHGLKLLEVQLAGGEMGTWHTELATYAPRELEVIVDRPAAVRVMTAVDFHLYSTGQAFDYLGDDREVREPVRISIPYAGRWHLVVVAEGDPAVSWRVV